LIFVLGFWTARAYAHVPTREAYVADWHWRPDVLFILSLLAIIYTGGWFRLRRRGAGAAPKWRFLLYLGGLSALILALISPIDGLASVRLSMHMVQHLLLLMISPLFLLLANPLAAFIWGLPGRVRHGFAGLFTRSSYFRSVLRALTYMPVAWFLYVVNLWAWHHPSLYQTALRVDWVHDIQHILFFITAILFWWPVVNPAPRLHGRISLGLRIVYLVAATLQNTLLGMIISLPERVLYPFYEASPWLRDLSPINDQALGGGIMWVSGHMYLIPIIALIARLLVREEETLLKRPHGEALENRQE
jgi:cytochrome c oxidase assembly factor CtaG